jgi:hypothetical protein
MGTPLFGIVSGRDRLIGVNSPRGTTKFEWSTHGFPLIEPRPQIDLWLACIRALDRARTDAQAWPGDWLHCCSCEVCSGAPLVKAGTR